MSGTDMLWCDKDEEVIRNRREFEFEKNFPPERQAEILEVTSTIRLRIAQQVWSLSRGMARPGDDVAGLLLLDETHARCDRRAEGGWHPVAPIPLRSAALTQDGWLPGDCG
eukprot:2967732-Rhodomonas_salina.2